MHTCPGLRHQYGQRSGRSLVQLGIGGWCSPEGVKVCRERGTNVLTVTDITEMGLEAAAQYAIERATDGMDCVYISSISTASMPASCPAPAGRNPVVCCHVKS